MDYCWMLGNTVDVGAGESWGSSSIVFYSYGNQFRQRKSTKSCHVDCHWWLGLDYCCCCCCDSSWVTDEMIGRVVPGMFWHGSIGFVNVCSEIFSTLGAGKPSCWRMWKSNFNALSCCVENGDCRGWFQWVLMNSIVIWLASLKGCSVRCLTWVGFNVDWIKIWNEPVSGTKILHIDNVKRQVQHTRH